MTPTSRRFIPPLIIITGFVAFAFFVERARLVRTLSEATPKVVAQTSKSATHSSNAPADINLAQEIDRAINESNLTHARWGVFVMSLKDGRVLCSHNGDQLFTPASNMKVYSTAVALDLLGTDYRWRTSAYAEKQPNSNGIVEGDLILYGRGAPDLISARKGSAPSLADLADQIYQRGVREVRGNVVGDSSYFRGELWRV